MFCLVKGVARPFARHIPGTETLVTREDKSLPSNPAIRSDENLSLARFARHCCNAFFPATCSLANGFSRCASRRDGHQPIAGSGGTARARDDWTGRIEPEPRNTVRVFSMRELAEIYDVRAVLEGYAAGLAAVAFHDNVKLLEDVAASMSACAARNDLHGFTEANARFHRLVVEAAGNQTLLDVWTQLDVRSRTTVNMIRTGRDLNAVAASHRPVIEALATGDGEQPRE